ncbi:AglZ/HisF2 family acetamidino modification protein [Achromobacter xylosoxidans]|uniref:AglZ/HisF2 family acetamidino modification protein n=1 Tax=Achromobacter TaxID=222 RepID=UPI00063F02F3|nr:AglZ/HisF2 family acetamidino modification protein [Achromobacter xylosoxidans]ELQ7838563.1 imidazole glycerol phosphate synthase subunit HisF [Pseudomonas aeruginosa]PNM91688.1 glycosyl amidation-associated protein WbuZ [Achromobacter xylosoxidans]CUJ03974.1 Imidazole glycerol phosphate synthase subunit HisF [Achromobacter xylosoxidans]CUJ09101.1 Imidazole glycerol phosphate synthase subunit HisF [Achromobacter xylosoxidans]CUJ56622.1 Imidazole glycerol phosphate synthase subunit HisF [Ach
MLRTRVIPCLLLKNGGLVKTRKFKNPTYIGDPINAVRIFNEKEVDELVFLDISATAAGREPDYELLGDIASEAFMPFAYGGGISTLEHARKLFKLGVEKVILNTSIAQSPALISQIAAEAGSQSVVVSIDVKRNLFGKYTVHSQGGTVSLDTDPVSHARSMERAGAGEILLTAIDRDGCMNGYDLPLITAVSNAVDIPVVASGGASSLHDFAQAKQAGASAVSAGSMFVFHGKHRAVLITYPAYSQLEALLAEA